MYNVSHRKEFASMAKIQNRSTKNDPVITALPAACADEAKAVEFMEQQRWEGSPCCPRCGSLNIYRMKDSKTGERQANYRWLCRDCKGAGSKPQFTVRTGTVFEDSKIELRHWCFAFWRAATSKKGVSALEIHRQTGVSYKSSLFMLSRIRFAMADSSPELLGPDGGDVEVDEAYIGGKPRYKGHSPRGGATPKQPIMAMVERGGSAKVSTIANVTSKTLKTAILENVHYSARILSDENAAYSDIGPWFERGHETVTHGKKEYVRAGTDIHSNTVESFFATVKRGLNGIYHSVSKKHLHRYLSEFEFRYNNRGMEDGERTVTAIQSAEGKRLFYGYVPLRHVDG
jgi:transposase-like protein